VQKEHEVFSTGSGHRSRSGAPGPASHEAKQAASCSLSGTIKIKIGDKIH
jgi:hypothetical protein